MSALQVRLLTCDGVDDGEVCDAEYGGNAMDESETRAWVLLRGDAAALGDWSSVGGRDYCPDHADQAREDGLATEASTYLTELRSLPAPADGGAS